MYVVYMQKYVNKHDEKHKSSLKVVKFLDTYSRIIFSCEKMVCNVQNVGVDKRQ